MAKIVKLNENPRNARRSLAYLAFPFMFVLKTLTHGRIRPMAASERSSRNHRTPAPAQEAALMTVTRPELLVNGSDAEFRTLIHRLMSFSRCINAIRDGFGSLAGVSGVQYEILMWVGRLQGAEGITVGEVSTAMRQSGA